MYFTAAILLFVISQHLLSVSLMMSFSGSPPDIDPVSSVMQKKCTVTLLE